MARDVGIAPNTAKSWLSILEASRQVFLLEPYHRSAGKRLIKTPKLYFTDSDDQNPDLQLAALKAGGCERIFTDKATEVHVKRPELTKCLKALAEGDTLTVWKLDRLGRSLRDLMA